MRKSLLLIVFAMVTSVSFAQVTWNVKGGMNISNHTDDNADAKVGFKLGGGLEYAFTDMFSIQPSMFISSKGAKFSEANVTINQVYLEAPVMGAARFRLSNKNAIVISAGPYLAYGVGGKRSTTIAGITGKVDTFGDDDSAIFRGYNRFDVGLGTGVAFEFGEHFSVSLDAQVGLTELSDYYDSKNLNMSICFGYRF